MVDQISIEEDGRVQELEVVCAEVAEKTNALVGESCQVEVSTKVLEQTDEDDSVWRAHVGSNDNYQQRTRANNTA